MRRRSAAAQLILFPFACLYGIVTAIRNRGFDMGILKSQTYNIPIINVGNITVGGTGKTPHIEFLINKLKTDYQIGTLSRGYKRKSKGFQIASTTPSATILGDEPAQLKNKFPDITVAVDADRRNGITNLLELKRSSAIDIILLDDAFQHRHVKAGLNILLIDYNRPIHKDKMLPSGDLREFPSGAKRADIIIITKCPDTISTKTEIEKLRHKNGINKQAIYFSKYNYQNLIALKDTKEFIISNKINTETTVLLLSGIASPKPLISYISKFTSKIEVAEYADHHTFTTKDINDISEKFNAISNPKKLIITTEKDVQRLSENKIPETLKDNTFYIPIRVTIINNQEEELTNTIKKYVTTNKRDH